MGLERDPLQRNNHCYYGQGPFPRKGAEEGAGSRDKAF
jgi:hypothetical protein